MKYFASCSFGKDSVATVLLALEHNEPLDEILFTEVMFDHARPRRAKWRVHFKNGNYRDVCGCCVKRFRENGDCAGIVNKIEKLEIK